MSLDSDALLDRINLKKKVTKWQLAALIFAIIAIIIAVEPKADLGNKIDSIKEEYIAKIEINGVISEDSYRSKILKELVENKKVKAVIVTINSPGGTTAGGEELYYQIRKISESGKPVVAVMKTLATSAGYLTAVAGDHIIARNGSITGSIGVIVQTAQVTDLAKMIGVKFHTFKSAPLKANPSPFEEVAPGAEKAMKAVVMSFYNYFVDVVTERRQMDRAKVLVLADGRIYSGLQALDNGLIDQIGGVDEAVEWLQTEKEINKDLKIEEISVIEEEKSFAEVLFGSYFPTDMISELNLTTGFLAIWQPEMQ